jgi:hypothetical protein
MATVAELRKDEDLAVNHGYGIVGADLGAQAASLHFSRMTSGTGSKRDDAVKIAV